MLNVTVADVWENWSNFVWFPFKVEIIMDNCLGNIDIDYKM